MTEKNYDKITDGKTVFIGFFIPECVWCKDMKPAWDEIMSIYKDNKDILVGEIDCSAGESMKFCEEHKIEYLPTIKYGNPEYLDEYEGARDIESLKTFLGLLKKFCSPDNLQDCDEKSKQDIEKYLKFSESDLRSAIEEKEKLIEKIKKEFLEKVRKLQKGVDELKKKQDESIDWINEQTGLGSFKSVDPEKPKCSPVNQENCDEKTKANIRKVIALSPQELQAAIDKKAKEIEEAKKHFENEVERLQFTKIFNKYQSDKAFEIQKVNDDGLSAMKIVERFKKSKKEKIEHSEL